MVFRGNKHILLFTFINKANTQEHVYIVFLILLKELLLHGIQMEQVYPLQRLMGHLQDHTFLTGLCSQEGNELCRVEVF